MHPWFAQYRMTLMPAEPWLELEKQMHTPSTTDKVKHRRKKSEPIDPSNL